MKIVYLAINPSPKRWDIRDAQQRTNQLIEAHCKAGQNLAFVDLWTSSIGPDGQPRAGAERKLNLRLRRYRRL